MFNKDLRAYAKKKGVFFWQIASNMGISEPTMTRKLRTELSEQDKLTFRKIIDELSVQKEASKK